jgi:ubiquinone/menaquinone biosynthesis C-methylase UbiE
VLRQLARDLTRQPWAYDLVQELAGSRRAYAAVREMLPPTAGRRVLDVGAGTGRARRVLSPDARYVAIELDLDRLRALRRTTPDGLLVSADAIRLPLLDTSVDIACCVFVLHHLNDDALRSSLRELARVVRDDLVIMDPLWLDRRPLSRLLWRYDDGAYPRSREQLLAVLSEFFEIERERTWTVLHRYLVCRCRPRRGAGLPC